MGQLFYLLRSIFFCLSLTSPRLNLWLDLTLADDGHIRENYNEQRHECKARKVYLFSTFNTLKQFKVLYRKELL